ncbi:hypothetical protein [Weissella cibaria]|uniref:hypothetical protein n=1 Tax=Weissella cibaria TaxID=137591 RepID=UPI00106DEAB4|nr:hypothetical protein [Weissella cibaria]
MMDQTTLAVFFGLMVLWMGLVTLIGVIVYYAFIGIKRIWLKRLGPAIRYLLTGDAQALTNRKRVIHE